MAENNFVQMIGLSEAQLTADHEAVIFTLQTTAGKTRIALRVEQLGNVLTFFAMTAGAVERAATARAPTRPRRLPTVVPISAKAFGVQPSPKPDTSLAVIGMGAVALAFEVPTKDLIQAAAVIAQSAVAANRGDKPH